MRKQKQNLFPRCMVALVLLFAPLTLASPYTPAQSQGQYTPPAPPPPASASEAAPPESATAAPTHAELDRIVGRIALYPDPLLAHVLTASTYWDDIPEAARWADEHSYLKGDALADAIKDDNLTWSPDILALLPFPSVLEMMAQDREWTRQLGEAVLSRHADVMDAVQRMRREAHKYGYLHSTPYDRVVDSSGDIEILPINPAWIYVPVYDPAIVFFPPPPGIFVADVIHFGPAIVVSPIFFAWGWMHPYFEWHTHTIFFDYVPWSRTWINRGYYIHPFVHPWLRPGPRIERHELRRK